MASPLCVYEGVALSPQDAGSSGHTGDMTDHPHQLHSCPVTLLRVVWYGQGQVPSVSADGKEWRWTGPQHYTSQLDVWWGKTVRMSSLHVLGDVPLQRSAIWTKHTSKRPLPCMSEQVLLQVICSVEEFTTNVAWVQLGAAHWSW